jgi:hypothetical protein
MVINLRGLKAGKRPAVITGGAAKYNSFSSANPAV